MMTWNRFRYLSRPSRLDPEWARRNVFGRKHMWFTGRSGFCLSGAPMSVLPLCASLKSPGSRTSLL